MKETFESAGEKLSEILALLEKDDTTLDNSIKLYSQAAELIAFCSDTISKAQIKVDEIDSTLSDKIEVDDGLQP